MASVLGSKQLLAVMTIQADSWYLDEGMVEIVLISHPCNLLHMIIQKYCYSQMFMKDTPLNRW